jgi:putative transposase
MNPVRARMVDRPGSYPWSSASAHLAGKNDALVKASPLLEIVGDWQAFLSDPPANGVVKTLQHHERTGRPLGDEGFLNRLEGLLNRVLKPKRPGRKPMKREK